MHSIHYFTDPPIYLDLGGALSAFGLIFAAYQLRKPQWDFVLRLRPAWQRNLIWILGGIGLLLTLLRVALTKFDISALCLPSIFEAPLFYEISAYIFFVFSPLSLVYFSTNAKDLFNEKSSKKFYEAMVVEVSRTNDEGVSAVLEVLLCNLRDICRAAHFCQNDEKMGGYARAILDVILSDEALVKILTTKRLDALQSIFRTIEEFELSQRESSIGISRIVKSLFLDKESFFYKHTSRDGLALSFNIYQSIFNSPVILTNFDLFGRETLEYSMKGEMSVAGIHVFIEALSRSIETYLTTGDVPPRHINNALSFLSEMFADLCFKISAEEERGVDTKYVLKGEWWSIYLIANFLGHSYPFLGRQEKLNEEIAEREKEVLEADFYSDLTINAGIAKALYKAFEQLSYIENTNDTYSTANELLNGMVYYGEHKEGYRKPFEKRMWEQIGRNVVGRYYPAALKTYLEHFGYHAASDGAAPGEWAKEQTERVRKLLYVDLKPLFERGIEMVNKQKMKDVLLPKSITYKDGNDGKFYYRFGFGKGEEKIILPPKEGAESALVGIDLKAPS